MAEIIKIRGSVFIGGMFMRMYTDPRGEAYEQVVDLAVRNSEWFVLKIVNPVGMDSNNYTTIVDLLNPYLVKSMVIQHDNMHELIQLRNTYRSDAFYTTGTYYIYRSCEESGNLLKLMATRLSDWAVRVFRKTCVF